MLLVLHFIPTVRLNLTSAAGGEDSKGPVTLSRIPHGYRPRFHIWKLTRMRVDHVKDLWICHGSSTDLLQSTTETQGQVCGCPFDCFFLIRKPFPCQSVADPVRSGYVLGDICWHGSITDERDATRTSRMVIWTIRTLTDELWMRYGRTMDTMSIWSSQKNQAWLIFL